MRSWRSRYPLRCSPAPLPRRPDSRSAPRCPTTRRPPFGTLASDPADCLPAGPGHLQRAARVLVHGAATRTRTATATTARTSPSSTATRTGAGTATFIGGGSDAPRFYTHVAGSRRRTGLRRLQRQKTIAVEVLDHEGLFNVYMERIRQQVAADGYNLDGIYISSTHDESAPDSLGLYGVNADHVERQRLLERLPRSRSRRRRSRTPTTTCGRRRSATRRPIEPENMRQCWSSYPVRRQQAHAGAPGGRLERQRDRHARQA